MLLQQPTLMGEGGRRCWIKGAVSERAVCKRSGEEEKDTTLVPVSFVQPFAPPRLAKRG